MVAISIIVFIILIIGAIFTGCEDKSGYVITETQEQREERERLERENQQKIDEEIEKVNCFCEEIEGKFEDGKYLFVDSETTGLPTYYDESIENIRNYPRVIQLGWMLLDKDFKCVYRRCEIMRIKGKVPEKASDINGITTEMCYELGLKPSNVYEDFMRCVRQCNVVICHNVKFDKNVIASDMIRNKMKDEAYEFFNKQFFCTMNETTEICKIPRLYGNGYKWPSLSELFDKLFLEKYNGHSTTKHNALSDVKVCAYCFRELCKLGYVFEKGVKIEVPDENETVKSKPDIPNM